VRRPLPAILAALLACAFVAPGALAAPSPETAATRAFLARQKAARKAFADALRAASSEASLAIGAAEQALAAGGSAPVAGEAIFAALREHQRAVQVAIDGASTEQADAASDALATLPSPVTGIYPEAFYPTETGAPAVFVDALESDLAKTYAKLEKRVARATRRFEAAGFSFAFRIRPPKPFDPIMWDESGTEGGGAFQPTVDLVVGWSELDVLEDVQLRASGSANQGPIQLNTRNRDEMGSNPSASDIPVVNDRFATDFAETALLEGLWIVYKPGTEPSELLIGVR
jgi:hypothetical protein